MPFGFMHLIFSWIIAKSYQYFKRVKISIVVWFFLFAGTVFPDIDYLLQWLFIPEVHRTYTHNLLMTIITFLVVYLIVKLLNKIKKLNWNARNLGLIFALGVLSHIFLDMVLGKPGVQLLWPFGKWYWFFGIGESFKSLPINERGIEVLTNSLKWAIADIGLGTLWLFYLMLKKKLIDF